MIVSTTVTEYAISPIYPLIFFFLIGFIYPILKNKEYKDTILLSCILGLIDGILFNPETSVPTNWIIWIGWLIIVVMIVIIGGLMAVYLKKRLKTKD